MCVESENFVVNKTLMTLKQQAVMVINEKVRPCELQWALYKRAIKCGLVNYNGLCIQRARSGFVKLSVQWFMQEDWMYVFLPKT